MVLKKLVLTQCAWMAFIAAVTFSSCIDNANDEAANAPKTIIEMPVVKDPLDTAGSAVKQTGLSPDEMKDDSVFRDGSRPSEWQTAGITDVKGLKLFIKQLQLWVAANDRNKLAAAIDYPLNKTIKTKEDFLAYYDNVFTKDIRQSFSNINFRQLFRNEHGVMLEGGKVWLSQQGKDFKISAINYPTEPAK